MEGEYPAEQEAVQGEKMIEVKVRFWANDIASDKDKIVPKRAWTSGIVRLKPTRRTALVLGRKLSPSTHLWRFQRLSNRLWSTKV